MVLNKIVLLLFMLQVSVSSEERAPRQLRFPPSKQTSRPRAVFTPVFRPAEDSAESEETDDRHFQQQRQQRPIVFRRPQQEPEPVFHQQVVPQRTHRPQQRPIVPSSTPTFVPSSSFSSAKDLNEVQEEEKEEESKPDRLTELLGGSKFDCGGKNLGYYADEGLSCEVFHYCADGVRHSWLCPAGQNFHQIHLICMPSGDDNICAQSQKFHFVNDYLYKPINEGTTENNETLKYHDRFFPGGGGGQQQARQQQQQQKPKKQQQQHHFDDFVAQPPLRSIHHSNGGRLPQFVAHRPSQHHRNANFRSHKHQDDDYDE